MIPSPSANEDEDEDDVFVIFHKIRLDLCLSFALLPRIAVGGIVVVFFNNFVIVSE